MFCAARGVVLLMIEIRVIFEHVSIDGSAGPVAGTVRRAPGGPAIPFAGWLQLLGHLEQLSGAADKPVSEKTGHE
jgi:hypothetical protein